LSLVCIGNPVVQAPAGASAFNLQANSISLQGFDISNSAIGIATSPGFSGYRITGNTIEGNSVGISLNSNGALPTLVKQNVIQNNNNPVGNAGHGILSNQALSNATITANNFVNNDNAGIAILP